MHRNTDVQEWFRRAGLGLFVHWGLSSVHGGVDLSWGMISGKPWDDQDQSIPPAEYYALAEEFDPDAFSPDRWLRAAREAGFEYATLTARHHDGFAMWPSEYGDFSTAEYCDGRDLVGEFVDACRRQDLKVGLYYSPRDWHHPAFPGSAGPYDDLARSDPGPEREDEALAPGEMSRSEAESPTAAAIGNYEAYYSYVTGQLKELLTRYGRIDHLWFDGLFGDEDISRGDGELDALIRSAQPDIVVNDRGGSPLYADYDTTECGGPDRPLSRPWERADIWADGWGHREDETYADLEWTLELIAETVGKGGNLLLNVGPKGDGSLPEGAYDRLGELADWMAHGKPAVTGVEAGPWPERADVPVTRTPDGETWYLHVLAAHDGPNVVVEHVPEPRTVRLLRTGERLQSSYDSGAKKLTVQVPPERRTSPDEVVAVTWAHPEPYDSDRARFRRTIPD